MSSDRPQIIPPERAMRPLVEWPTLGMIIVCYVGWWIALMWAPQFSATLAVVLLAVLIALHSSLQHEVLHGHPFRSALLSEAMVFPAVGLFVPYQRFRDLHLQHHYDPNLTDPYDDPESNYMDPAVWSVTSPLMKRLYRFNNLLLGRMVVGPILSLWGLYRADAIAVAQRNSCVTRAYLWHGLGMVPVLWLVWISPLSIATYLLASYMGLSLLKIRTFLEHRAHEKVPGRTVIIESRGPLSILFLNNNYHAVHHANPCLPWYQLPAFYAARRSVFLERNKSYFYRSYADVFRQYFLRSKDPVPHPLREKAHVDKELELS